MIYNFRLDNDPSAYRSQKSQSPTRNCLQRKESHMQAKMLNQRNRTRFQKIFDLRRYHLEKSASANGPNGGQLDMEVVEIFVLFC